MIDFLFFTIICIFFYFGLKASRPYFDLRDTLLKEHKINGKTFSYRLYLGERNPVWMWVGKNTLYEDLIKPNDSTEVKELTKKLIESVIQFRYVGLSSIIFFIINLICNF